MEDRSSWKDTFFFANNLCETDDLAKDSVCCFAASLKLPHYPFCLFQRGFVINYDTDQTRIYYHNVVIYKRPVFVTVLVPCSNHSAILDLQPLTNACLNVCWGFRVCGQKSLICLIFGENVVLPAQRLQGNFAPGHILKWVLQLQLYALSCLLAEQQHQCTVRINMSKHISECAFVLKVKTNSESIAESA